jgi:glycosyltransferase involved in cell wall biosynthesis
MPAPLLLDLSHTSHSHARTGIQRVARSLYTALGGDACAITYDPHGKLWRALDRWERANLAGSAAAVKRGAQWPLRAKLHGRARRLLGRTPALPDNRGALVPEVFSATVARALPDLFAHTRGPRVALFHDAIALKLPELAPRSTVARFPAYMLELLRFDGIAAVSNDSRSALGDYWRWLRVESPPPIQTISLGMETRPSPKDGEIPPTSRRPVVLSVGTIEGRKNHLSLLDACETLWQRGVDLELRLIGLAHPNTGAAALAKVRALQSAGRPLRYDGPVADDVVDAAYAGCQFTVYPSLMEGFGLPVIESLAHGKPCVCSGRGAIGESARGGGCVELEQVDAATIANALARLIHNPLEVAALAKQARARRFKTWHEYATEIIEWMRELQPRARVPHV